MKNYYKYGRGMSLFKTFLQYRNVLLSNISTKLLGWYTCLFNKERNHCFDKLSKSTLNFRNISKSLRIVDLLLLEIQTSFLTPNSLDKNDLGDANNELKLTNNISSNLESRIVFDASHLNSQNARLNNLTVESSVVFVCIDGNNDHQKMDEVVIEIFNTKGCDSLSLTNVLGHSSYEYKFGRKISVGKENRIMDAIEKNIVNEEELEVEKDGDDNILCTDEIDSYTKYLASMIYEYQLRLKHSAVGHEIASRIKQTRNLKSCICDQINKVKFRIYKALAFSLRLTVISILVSSIMFTPARGQRNEGIRQMPRLQIGDTIPEELWNLPLQVVNHPEGKDIITLHDFRDKKLIIMDFWSTYCGSCYYTFPITFNKVAPYTDAIALLPMTYQERQIVVKVVERNTYLQSINGFYTVVNSLWFRSLFGVDWFPQLIIIDSKGTILGHLRPSQLSEDVLFKLLNGQPVILPTISYQLTDSVLYDKNQPLVFTERRIRSCVI